MEMKPFIERIKHILTVAQRRYLMPGKHGILEWLRLQCLYNTTEQSRKRHYTLNVWQLPVAFYIRLAVTQLWYSIILWLFVIKIIGVEIWFTKLINMRYHFEGLCIEPHFTIYGICSTHIHYKEPIVVQLCFRFSCSIIISRHDFLLLMYIGIF